MRQKMKKSKGYIYFDKSYKGMKWGKPCNHNEYCAEITVNGKRYRKRSRIKSVCEDFIQNILNRYGNKGENIENI